jgi:hypothetical protein
MVSFELGLGLLQMCAKTLAIIKKALVWDSRI